MTAKSAGQSNPCLRNSELREMTAVKPLPREGDGMKVYTESDPELTPIPVRMTGKPKT